MVETQSLPIEDGKQMTGVDVFWLALYCMKVPMLFIGDFESRR